MAEPKAPTRPVQLIYRPTEVQGCAKDYEFSRATMQARWAQGLSDAQATPLSSPWLAPMPPEIGARTFDVLREIRVRGAHSSAETKTPGQRANP